jgi:hypothetical protein
MSFVLFKKENKSVVQLQKQLVQTFGFGKRKPKQGIRTFGRLPENAGKASEPSDEANRNPNKASEPSDGFPKKLARYPNLRT